MRTNDIWLEVVYLSTDCRATFLTQIGIDNPNSLRVDHIHLAPPGSRCHHGLVSSGGDWVMGSVFNRSMIGGAGTSCHR
jgi:hypothetical protein